MASTVIHMCVASEINKRKKVNNYNEFLLGSVAPDISKIVGWSRSLSHFISKQSIYPDIDKFLNKYGGNLGNDFLLGYYVHLYTDYLWFKYFIRDLKYKGLITLADGTKIDYDVDTFSKYLYNDYTNLNVKLLDEYNLDLSLFYEPLVKPNVNMDEIPLDRLQELLDASSVVIKNTKEKKSYLFDLGAIEEFIKVSTDLICSEMEKLAIDKDK